MAATEATARLVRGDDLAVGDGVAGGENERRRMRKPHAIAGGEGSNDPCLSGVADAWPVSNAGAAGTGERVPPKVHAVPLSASKRRGVPVPMGAGTGPPLTDDSASRGNG